MSKIPGQAKKIQYTSACCNKVGLPTPSGLSHGLAADARAVTCPDCQLTAEFLADYKLQTGEEFGKVSEDSLDQETP